MKGILSFLKNEYLYSIITKFISLVIALVQSILVARYLGSSLQGTNSYILSITSVGSILVTFGMHQAYPYFRKKEGKEKIYKDFISIIIFLYSLYFIIGIIMSAFVLKSLELKASSILIPLYGLANVLGYICLIETPNKRNTWWTIIQIIDIIFVIGLMMLTERSTISGIIILSFSETMKCVVFFVLLRCKPRFHRGLVMLFIELIKMGFFPMLALLMTTLNYKIDILMLRHFPSITAAQIGVYSIGMLFADKIVVIPDTLKGVLVSKLSKGADEHEVAKVARLCFWASVTICCGFLILGEPMINMLYGKDYNGAFDILMICSVGSIFVGYFKLIAQYNIVNKKQIRNVTLLSGSIIINALLNLILIPRYGLRGAAFASGVGYFLTGIIFIIWFSKLNNIPLNEMFWPQKSDINSVKNFYIRRKK